MMYKYIKYGFTPILMSLVTVGLFLGGGWMWLGLAAILIFVVGGDALPLDDLSEPKYRYKWILNFNLYFTFPVLLVMLFALALMSGHGSSDPFGIDGIFSEVTGYDIVAARAETSGWHLLGGVLSVGLAMAGYGTNVAHELTHRTRDKKALLVGRWLLAMGCQADFAIEHVYGHHANVATKKDPATAIRGENVYSFILRSTIGGHLSAWRIELKRLKVMKQSPYWIHNKMITGYLMSLVFASCFYVIAGWIGVFVYFGQAVFSKIILEIVNYMEHYGLVRVEGTPVLPKHSWNTNKWMSSLVLYSLTRHSAHHERGSLPFWDLKPYTEAPTMPFGYLTTILITLCPPLWKKVMHSKLKDWDHNFASPAERELVGE